MAVYQCKICGSKLEAAESAATGICPNCDTEQTLPRIYAQTQSRRFEQAEQHRLDYGYSQAIAIYERVLRSGESDPELHWRILLSKYGVMYRKIEQDEPSTYKWVLTCNRLISGSIYDDDHFRYCCDNAASAAREIYLAEADEVELIQESARTDTSEQEPFDVFISFKRRDDKGVSTPDYLHAEKIFEALTDTGLRVFFSPSTLEEWPGGSWKYRIDAALASAKVLIAIGTSSENYNSFWVRYEWKNYLDMRRQDSAAKTLIPVFEGMRNSKLPGEFREQDLQTVDMSNNGWLDKLIGRVCDITGEKANPATATPQSQSTTRITHARLFCESGDFASAKTRIDQVIDGDPGNAEAYLINLMIELECSLEEDIVQKAPIELSAYVNYKMAQQFGDTGLKTQLDVYDMRVKERLAEEQRAKANRVLRVEPLVAPIRPVDKPADIEWRELYVDKTQQRVLVIARDCVAMMPYHEEMEYITWEDCTLRSWLNGEFFNSILPEAIKRRVIEVENQNPDSRWSVTGGRPTWDKVFLLSTDEAHEYFASDYDRIATFHGSVAWWWLRLPGNDANYAATVDIDGYVGGDGNVAGQLGVRPALWLSL
ncbi:MAG: toll/interleukin-1 receptor domain-containing protein [Coriobacteriia bacterium]|nr:toll/interleukin-1 receptor domain-containing protein [Coriobacteriia bacterium]